MMHSSGANAVVIGTASRRTCTRVASSSARAVRCAAEVGARYGAALSREVRRRHPTGPRPRRAGGRITVVQKGAASQDTLCKLLLVRAQRSGVLG
eukprot:6202107-Pleurochrysis_carterae.AAC.3